MVILVRFSAELTNWRALAEFSLFDLSYYCSNNPGLGRLFSCCRSVTSAEFLILGYIISYIFHHQAYHQFRSLLWAPLPLLLVMSLLQTILLKPNNFHSAECFSCLPRNELIVFVTFKVNFSNGGL